MAILNILLSMTSGGKGDNTKEVKEVKKNVKQSNANDANVYAKSNFPIKNYLICFFNFVFTPAKGPLYGFLTVLK